MSTTLRPRVVQAEKIESPKMATTAEMKSNTSEMDSKAPAPEERITKIPPPAPSPLVAVRDFVLLLVMGFAFGFFFERSHVYEPLVIREQFIFKTMIMLKMFMGAVVGACISFFIWNKIDRERMQAVRESRLITSSSATRVLLGGGILGAGMVVGGACPGMVLPQVGTGVGNAWITLLGGFFGAFLANVLKAVEGRGRNNSSCAHSGACDSALGGSTTQYYVDNSGSKSPATSSNLGAVAPTASTKEEDLQGTSRDPPSAESKLQTKNFSAATTSASTPTMQSQYADLRFGIPFNTAMIAFGLFSALFCLVCEILLPFKDELHNHGKNDDWKDHAWPPSLCGLGIGLVNLGSVFIAARPIGSSTAYAQLALMDQLIPAKFPQKLKPFEKFQLLGWYWQVPYLMMSVFGAYCSARLADNLPSGAPYVQSEISAFLGGTLMLFGSRLGGGCTSGHGIAGMPLLNLWAIGAVCSMFGVGIVVAVSMELAGELALHARL
ncbi:unnamed protein product [Amoebophrya sp. A120]|nr:unnamed protein product [Amoebophrya sp. A120]|eukprot:GSA120T00007535001.1